MRLTLDEIIMDYMRLIGAECPSRHGLFGDPLNRRRGYAGQDRQPGTERLGGAEVRNKAARRCGVGQVRRKLRQLRSTAASSEGMTMVENHRWYFPRHIGEVLSVSVRIRYPRIERDDTCSHLWVIGDQLWRNYGSWKLRQIAELQANEPQTSIARSSERRWWRWQCHELSQAGTDPFDPDHAGIRVVVDLRYCLQLHELCP